MNDIDVALGCADSNFTKASVTGVLAAEVRRLREENERLRKDAERMNGNIVDLRKSLARYREREMTMGWNQE